MKNILFYLLLCTCSLAFAQKEAAIWYFGNNAGLDFNSGAPVPLTNGQLITDEGSAVISDSNGDLLFYTDGTTVYNRRHEIMLNGEELKGHYSSTNSAIIVPRPGNPSRYFIFTTDAQFMENGLQYSEVDLSLSNGLGAVTSTKNILLEPQITEKLTAIKIPGENAYYVLTHRAHSNEFLAYKVTANGVNENPVVSAIGPNITWPYTSSMGQIKISPDGKKLCVATQALGFELYDFNSTTGRVSNYEQLFTDWSTYGVEFSPNSNLLYTTSSNFGVVQYDLKAGGIEDIRNSAVTLKEGSYTAWGLQLGIDGKIYVATSTWSPSSGAYLDVITNPNTPGIACNYREEALFLGGRRANLNLPPFIQSFFYISGITAEYFCLGEKTQFSVSTNSQIDQIVWDFGDGTSSNQPAPEHLYQQPGNFTVTVKIVSNGETDEETKEIVIYEKPVAHSIKDFSICSTEGSFSFDLSSLNQQVLKTQNPALFEIHYFSSLTDAENNQNELQTTITNSSNISEFLYARIANKSSASCFDLVKFRITVSEEPKLNTASAWSVCSPSGNYEFLFTEKDAEILGDQDGELFEVLYFQTEQNALENRSNINSLTRDEHATSHDEIFFRIQNNQNPDCFKIGNFQISVSSGIPVNETLQFAACNQSEGFGEFNTSTWKDAILIDSGDSIEFVFFKSNGDVLDISENAIYDNEVPFSEIIRVEIKDRNKPSCVAETEIKLLVNPTPEWTLQETYTVCGLEPFLEIAAPIDYDEWEWKFENSIISGTSQVRFEEEGVYSFKGTKTENGITCDYSYNVLFQRSELPQITDVSYKDWSGNNFIEIHSTGEGEFEFSIDGVNFTDSNYFGNLKGGVYTVFVRDKKGCGMDSETVTLIDYPKFFSPNNDGYNDFWQIQGVQNYTNSLILIFDRYGKLIKQIQNNDLGWDGTFNGQPMPAEDYWFSLKLENGKVYKNHFSLIR